MTKKAIHACIWLEIMLHIILIQGWLLLQFFIIYWKGWGTGISQKEEKDEKFKGKHYNLSKAGGEKSLQHLIEILLHQLYRFFKK